MGAVRRRIRAGRPGRLVVLVVACVVVALGGSAARAAGFTRCPAIAINGGGVRVLSDGAVIQGAAGDNAAFFIQTSGASCPAAQELLATVLKSPDESTALGASGYRLLSEHHERDIAGHNVYSVEAARGSARLRYWRFGARIDIDHTIYRPGQHIDFPRPDVNGYYGCTAAWVVELRDSGQLAALTAGHCLEFDPHVFREVHGGRTTVLGTVLTRAKGLDAGVFSLDNIPSGFAQQVERGGLPPRTATGFVPNADQHKGDRVCFAGRITGADQCGQITGRYLKVSKTQICTDIVAHQGDSGGPVYTDAGGATTRAVGIVAVLSGPLFHHQNKMCYVPIEPILDSLDAKFG